MSTSRCGVKVATAKDLNIHTNRTHQGPSLCQYCCASFRRKDHKDRHERESCPKNPARQEDLRTEGKGAADVESDNAFLLYHEIGQNSPRFPRIDTTDPVTFRGEVMCRYPECVHPVSVYSFFLYIIIISN